MGAQASLCDRLPWRTGVSCDTPPPKITYMQVGIYLTRIGTNADPAGLHAWHGPPAALPGVPCEYVRNNPIDQATRNT